VTAREYAQTLSLLEREGIPYTLIGRHRGKSLARKAWGLLSRSLRLVAFARGRGFDVAFSHASNDLAVAAWLRRIPHLIVHDYEHANLSYAVNARLASRILVPEVITPAPVIAHGARAERVGTFPGLKEHVYLDAATVAAADPAAVRRELGIADADALVVVRPPATMSAYHRFENERFDALLELLVSASGARVVLLPRTPEQRAALAARFGGRALMPEAALDGTSLVLAAACVVSAGGTMNREAAVLGTPAYTVFAGEMGAVDRDLVARGMLVEVGEDAVVPTTGAARREPWFVDNRGAILAEVEALGQARHPHAGRGGRR
jgi:hypothetical protein